MKKKKGSFQFVLEMLGTHKLNFILSVVFAILNAGFIIAPYFIMYQVLDRMVSDVSASAAFEAGFYLPRIFIMLGLWIIAAIVKFISTILSHFATFDILKNIRLSIARRLSEMPLGDVEKLNSGTIKSIMVERVDSCEDILSHVVPECLSGILAGISLLVIMFFIDWRIGLASFACVFVGIIFFAMMMRGATSQFKNCTDKTKILNDTAVDYINGIEVIKVFGKENDSYENFKTACHDGAYCYINWMRNCIIPQTGGMVICPYTLLGILPAAFFIYKYDSLSLSSLLLIIILSVTAIGFLITVFSYQDDIAQFGVIKDEVLILLEANVLVRPEKMEKKPEGNDIHLTNVTFGYEENKDVLKDVSLDIEAGSFVALVGPSGAGKSTLGKLIASYYDPREGAITIGGVDIKSVPLYDFNKMVSYVSQNNYLFDTTIYENIRVAKPEATNEEIEEICKKCGIDEFIRSLENGYNTIVGSKGNSISGGERQRITIARAMMKNAPIVVLDEATAYTDPENEALIQKSLSALVKDKTLIVIAHRLNTIVNADKIVVVNNGKIEEEGKHFELLNKNGLYKEMWESFRESEAE